MLALLTFFLVSPALFAYVVKLKDGSLVFARAPYTVKGTRAIITLENGTVTQIDVAKIDVPGTVKYNRDNFGNVIALDTPQEKVFQLATPVPQSKNPLQDLIRQRRGNLGRPTPGSTEPQAGSAAASPETSQPDPIVQAAFSRIFEGTGLTQYRVTNNRGKTRLLANVSSEQAVFNTLSASARAIVEAAERGRSGNVEVVLTTGSGEPAGTFEMTPAQAKLLVDRGMSVQDYFVKNVIF
ncbi:MAG TPA: hypothetical protein VKS03_03075 [Thermoanaerobaculia bacterium]|nr:hypothetical protein [Thermoanaerobaculia bacterium]